MAKPGARVLVVTDDPRMETITQSIERAEGDAEVLRARPEDALAEIDRLRPDVVLIASDSPLIRTLRDAERKSDRKTEFLASMSHEIRTPLNTMLGMAELLGETKLDDRQRGYVQTLQRAADHVLALIEDVLDISRIEAGSVTTDDVGFDLYEVAESAIDIVRVQARRKKLDVGWGVGADVARELRGDPRRLRQVLVNLLGNAVKFTDQGRVWLSIARDGEQIRFSVSDTGIGIPRDKLDSIFDGFVQADRSIEQRFGGFGLGLAISRELASAQAGRIEVGDSRLGGARMALYLPSADAGQ